MNRFFVLVAFVALGCGVAACAPKARFAVRVNAIALDESAAPGEGAARDAATFALWPADPEVDPRDLQYREFASILARGLVARGGARVEEPSEAETVILVRYGVGDRETQHISYPLSHHDLRALGYPRYGPHGAGRCRNRSHRHRAIPYTALDPFPSRRAVRTVTTFNRYLELEARQIEPGKDFRAGTPVWSTQVESRGGSDDLRRIFPVLAVAAFEYLSADTEQLIELVIEEDDERVQRVRNGQTAKSE